MKLEAVITCVRYADYLAQTLPFTTSQFDRVVVVTSHDDEDTPRLCRYWSVDCVRTDAFTEGGGSFAKGRAINHGLLHLKQDDWVVHLDGDIAVPLTLRRELAMAGLSADSIYGAERFDVHGCEEWAKLKVAQLEEPRFTDGFFVTAPTSRASATVLHREFGYCPLGYFQMWNGPHAQSKGIRYTDVRDDASTDDMVFALNWPRAKRIMLPQIRLLHLQASAEAMGANWKGRTTSPFANGYKAR